MKRYFLLFVTVICMTLPALADNILLLTNPKTKETNVFREGSYLVFELKADNTMHEGYIRQITDSSIVFDNAQVSLSQINVYAGTTKARIVGRNVVNAIGNTLLFTGMTVFDFGLSIMLYDDYYYWPIGGTVWLAGAFIAGLGHAFDWAASPPEHSVRVRNYRNWDASIKTDGQPVTENHKVLSTDTIPNSPDPVREEQPKEKKTKRSGTTNDDVYGD